MTMRIYTPGRDDSVILDLRARVWGADHPHTSPAFYKWLFQDTPSGPGTGVLDEKDGAALGFAGMTNRLARMGDQDVKIAHGLDFMVDPGLGGMLSGRVGVRVLNRHAKLADEISADVNLNYPNDNSLRMLTSSRVSYDHIFSPDLFVCPLGAPRVRDRGALAAPGIKLAGVAGGSYAALRGLGAGRGISVSRIETFDDRFDDHWERLCADGKLRFNRDRATLDWRYSAHPIYSYTKLIATRGEELLGYVILSKRDFAGLDALLVCDLGVAGNDARVAAALLAEAKQEAKAQKTRLLVSQAIDPSALSPLLRSAGFLKVPPRFNPKCFRMIAMAHTTPGQSAMTASHWAFGWGDMDVV